MAFGEKCLAMSQCQIAERIAHKEVVSYTIREIVVVMLQPGIVYPPTSADKSDRGLSNSLVL